MFKMLPRYKEITALTQEVSDDISYDYREVILSNERNIESVNALPGGRLNTVVRVISDSFNGVYKFSHGAYRVAELHREWTIMSSLEKMGLSCGPELIKYRDEGVFAYIKMAFIEGKSLRALLSKCTDQPLRSLYFKQLGQGVSLIHEQYGMTVECNEWINGQLEMANINFDRERFDIDDFNGLSPSSVLEWLNDNKPIQVKHTVLHGDLRTKNVIVDKNNMMKLIDWGFVDIGDPYYDLAIMDYYFLDESDRASFYQGYDFIEYDKSKIDYYDKLSWFINI